MTRGVRRNHQCAAAPRFRIHGMHRGRSRTGLHSAGTRCISDPALPEHVSSDGRPCEAAPRLDKAIRFCWGRLEQGNLLTELDVNGTPKLNTSQSSLAGWAGFMDHYEIPFVLPVSHQCRLLDVNSNIGRRKTRRNQGWPLYIDWMKSWLLHLRYDTLSISVPCGFTLQRSVLPLQVFRLWGGMVVTGRFCS